MQLSLTEYGSGRPLVILHGLFGSRDNWHTVATRLADIRRCITMDLPNHGESPHTDEFTYDLMADAVADTIRGSKIEACDILGHSMGGKAAMRLAQRSPELVKSLVAADIAPVDYSNHSHADIIAGFRAVDLDAVSSRRDADEMMQDQVPNKMIRAFLLKNLLKNEDGYSWRLNVDAIESNYETIRGYPQGGAVFEGPALFIAGERSDYVDHAARSAIAERFPVAKVETMKGVGHWLHAENQDEFVSIVWYFLQGV